MTGGRKELRPHQRDALAMLRHSVAGAAREKRRARMMLMLATGAGKTVIAAAIVRGAREKGNRVLFIVDAISLIDQTAEAFLSERITEIGVIQADHPMTDWSRPVQIASIQTLQNRGMPPADIVIVDEAHGQNEWLTKVMQSESWRDIPFIGLSATPWSKGLGNLYDELWRPVSMQALIDAGYLCPFRVFAAGHPDLSGVKTTAGDYQQDQLSAVMANGNIVADVVDTWRRLGENRPTFAFAVDRAHAKALQRRFEQSGVPAGYIDAHTPIAERKEVRKQLDRGEIRIVCNVGCLTKGVDWAIGCIILARPTKSEMLYVQMVGRGLRVNDGIPDCIILDHADNTLRMGFVTDVDEGRTSMCTAQKGERKKVERDVPLPKECPSCQYLKAPKVRACPSCGFTPERQSTVGEADGELKEVRRTKLVGPAPGEKQRWYSELNAVAVERHYKAGWVANAYKKKFGVWPRGLSETTLRPSDEVRRYVKSLTLAFIHRRAA